MFHNRRLIFPLLAGTFAFLGATAHATNPLEFYSSMAIEHHERLQICPFDADIDHFEALHADNWILFRNLQTCDTDGDRLIGCETHAVHVTLNRCERVGLTAGVATQERAVLTDGSLNGVSRIGMDLIPLQLDVNGTWSLFVDRHLSWEVVILR